MRQYKVSFEPGGKIVDIDEGRSLLDAAKKADIRLNAVCGGRGTCGKCVVEVGQKQVLACEFKVFEDVRVYIPKNSQFSKQRILQDGIEYHIAIAPCLRKDIIVFDRASDKELKDRFDRLFADSRWDISSDLLAKAKKDMTGEFTAVSIRLRPKESEDAGSCDEAMYKVIALERGDTTDKLFGCAIDIGTTTMVAKLIDMRDGKITAIQSRDNPGAEFGADVISRISYAASDEKLEHIHKVTVKAVDKMIGNLSRDAGITRDDIYEISLAGNTTMNHMFLNRPVKQLGQIPFKAHFLQAQNVSADGIGIRINSAGNVYVMANIASFVGADTTAVALAVDIGDITETTLIMDIGTNSELILAKGGKIYAASCPAGPAFEGAMIAHGSRAAAGAVEAVKFNNDDIEMKVIGDVPARTICGSGLIDAIAVMIDLGIIDSTGRMVDKTELEGKVTDKILARIIDADGQKVFLLADNSENAVYVTQKDVRHCQLAKAAIKTGVIILQNKVGVDDSQLKEVLLAGAFGNYINSLSARTIGLIPDVDIEKVRSIGNAACTGAAVALLNCDKRFQSETIAENIEHIELADTAEFNTVYADAMMF